MILLLKRALQALDLWPQPGQVAPPCGYTPAQMRQEVRSVINRIDGELLLAIYHVVMVMSTMRNEFAPPSPPPAPTPKLRRNGLEFDGPADWNAHRVMVRQTLSQADQILRDAANGGQP